eukprot:c22273_g2_i4 orf=433-711(-)
MKCSSSAQSNQLITETFLPNLIYFTIKPFSRSCQLKTMAVHGHTNSRECIATSRRNHKQFRYNNKQSNTPFKIRVPFQNNKHISTTNRMVPQ